MELIELKPLTDEYLEQIGFMWHTDSDESSYVSDEVVAISEDEANAYYEAANELYDMYCKGAEYVIENNLFHELNIPFNLVDIIKSSWENDVHWHLYGRFDLAGGVDGRPIKLLEFNADTPTSLYESAIIQWALLKANGLDEAKQFNSIYEALRDNFKRIVTLGESVEEFDTLYQGWKMLFSSVSDNDEEVNTTKFLQHIASEAGFHTEYEYIQNVEFSDDGVFAKDKSYELFFKLIPWEDIAIDESELAMILTNIVKNQNAIIFNPAYTLLFQSKGMLKVLWDLFPNHPLLLETSFSPLKSKKYVEKKCFGREGANIKIVNADDSIVAQNGGEYENHKSIFQEYVSLPIDAKGLSYQAGVFYAYEACGLGFRKGGLILDNMSKFVGHMIR